LAEVKDRVLPDYRDTGCAVYSECLECPLPRCIEELPNGKQRVRSLRRAIAIDKLHKKGKSLDVIAVRFNVSVRTVYRSLALLKK
jgi:hypothetical protein